MAINYKIVSLGGSLLVPPGGINIEWLRRFSANIKRQVSKGGRFIIVVGGGQTARQYIAAAQGISKIDPKTADWLGISATKLNAQLLIAVMDSIADLKLISDPLAKLKSNKPVLVAGGYRPGNSTDYVAVLLAKTYKIRQILNLTNVDYVYDRNPGEPGAQALKQASWKEFRQIIGNDWRPGMNAPFDPVASRLAESLELEVMIANGMDLPNLSRCLSGQKPKGTLIS